MKSMHDTIEVIAYPDLFNRNVHNIFYSTRTFPVPYAF